MVSSRWFIAFFLCLPVWSQAAESVSVYIGVAAPLTEARGKATQQAVQLALDEVNRAPARIGGKLVNFQIWAQDDKSEDRTTSYVARSFAQSDTIAVIGHTLTSASVLAAPIYQQAGMAMVSPYAWGNALTEQGFQTTFQAISNDRRGMAMTARHMVGRMKLKTFFLIDDGGLLGLGLSEAMRQGVEQAGGKVMQRTSVSSKTSDFNEVLRQVKSLSPDVVFFSGRVTQSDVFVRNLFRLGIQSHVLVTDNVVNAAYLASVGEVQDRLYAITPYFADDQNTRFRDVSKRYAARFNEPAPPPFIIAYDVAHAIIAAARAADSLDRLKIVEALRKIRYAGVNGEISFNPDGSLMHPAYTLYQVKDRQWRVLETLR